MYWIDPLESLIFSYFILLWNRGKVSTKYKKNNIARPHITGYTKNRKITHLTLKEFKSLSRKKRLWFNILGWTFLVLGILGCFLPFLQGILFILVGLYFLSHTTPWANKLLMKLRNRYPKIATKSEEFIKKFSWKST
ncbi:PGPGW domain-containing protein [Hazenella coriacea]|uniref:PGPGW domain-containing protein n=1 Tax=Hazenella coriacea TaxID=1179467 RepID=UPI003C78644B